VLSAILWKETPLNVIELSKFLTSLLTSD